MRSDLPDLTPPPIVLVDRPEASLVQLGGALVSIRRSPLRGARLVEAGRAIERAASASPRGLVLLTAFRLSRGHPIEPGFDANARELAETLRAVERLLVANAVLIEFDGMLATATRALVRTVWTLVRPRAAMGQFVRLSDAITWLLPHARSIGATDDPAAYVRLYRDAERRLEDHDAAQWARSG
ncbi:hypothetical protein [Sandaracinus amylolyticus]|uniref:hypothetical protein n=1 Tax=Sandaracinus amylolyticus TaxID=927083 RepID=UPI001F193628|nr:hypothetical protein [Sandaracinus amylolyticus]UJR84581.1 Hypothetical protein I5071_66600 [Sandaracinus amylolyticus]